MVALFHLQLLLNDLIFMHLCGMHLLEQTGFWQRYLPIYAPSTYNLVHVCYGDPKLGKSVE